jgi:hypothetical protein
MYLDDNNQILPDFSIANNTPGAPGGYDQDNIHWTDLAGFAAGLALILFGVRFLRKGFDRLWGGRRIVWLEGATRNRVQAMCTGCQSQFRIVVDIARQGWLSSVH